MANVDTRELMNKAFDIIDGPENNYPNIPDAIWKNEKCDDTFNRIASDENYAMSRRMDKKLDRGNEYEIPNGNLAVIDFDTENNIEKYYVDMHPNGSIIKGIAISVSNNNMRSTSVNIIPTANEGFRYTGLDEKNRVVDLGPVNTPVIVGDDIRPCGLYVPFSDIDAVNQSIEFLNAIRQSF